MMRHDIFDCVAVNRQDWVPFCVTAKNQKEAVKKATEILNAFGFRCGVAGVHVVHRESNRWVFCGAWPIKR